MVLMNGILAANGELNLKKLCKSYAMWMNSSPFHVGNTTRHSLQGCDYDRPDPKAPYELAKEG